VTTCNWCQLHLVLISTIFFTLFFTAFVTVFVTVSTATTAAYVPQRPTWPAPLAIAPIYIDRSLRDRDRILGQTETFFMYLVSQSINSLPIRRTRFVLHLFTYNFLPKIPSAVVDAAALMQFEDHWPFQAHKAFRTIFLLLLNFSISFSDYRHLR
jgi:hypothetical protein